jgi:hypothetical protein
MAGKRVWVILTALVFVIGGVAVRAAGSPGSNGPRASSATARAEAGPSCKKCKKIVRRAKKCKAQSNDSAKCKKAIKKAKKCRKILKSERCRKPAGGGGGGGGSPSPTPSPSSTTGGGSCPAYVPGEQGAGKPTSIVTDAATEAKPIEITVATEEAAGGQSPGEVSQFHNIQVDPAAAETGLWVRFEMAEGEDYDITLNYADGSEAAAAGGYNPAPVIPGETDGTGSGGHSETTAEQLDGIKSPDCQGYTLDMASFQTPGGDKTLKLWLGEAKYTPGG